MGDQACGLIADFEDAMKAGCVGISSVERHVHKLPCPRGVASALRRVASRALNKAPSRATGHRAHDRGQVRRARQETINALADLAPLVGVARLQLDATRDREPSR